MLKYPPPLVDSGPLPIDGPVLAAGPPRAPVPGGRLRGRIRQAAVRRSSRSGNVQCRSRGCPLCGERARGLEKLVD